MNFIWAALSLLAFVRAHGNIITISTNGVNQSAWFNDRDAYIKPPPQRLDRAVQGNTPIKDVQSEGIVCNLNNDVSPDPSKTVADIDAGSDIVFKWTPWYTFVHTYSHHGPIITYMAACDNNDCTTFHPNGKKIWFKIHEVGFVKMETTDGKLWPHFATADLSDVYDNHWSVTIPADIAPGQYLVRHEIFALHLANNLGGAEMYPSCTQVNVRGNGNAKPSDLVAFPGAYSADDPGIHFNLYGDGGFRDLTTAGYPIPGPPVYKAQSNPAPAADATSSAGDATSEAGSNASTASDSAPAAEQYTLSRELADFPTTGSVYHSPAAASAASSQTKQKGKKCRLLRRRKKSNR